MKNGLIVLTHAEAGLGLIPTSACPVANSSGWEFACGATVVEGIVDYSKGVVPIEQALEKAEQTRTSFCPGCEFSAVCCSYAGVLSAGCFLDTQTHTRRERALPAIFAPGLYS